jgi:hypothetical protein
MSTVAFWVVMPCNLVDGYQRSEERIASIVYPKMEAKRTDRPIMNSIIVFCNC